MIQGNDVPILEHRAAGIDPPVVSGPVAALYSARKPARTVPPTAEYNTLALILRVRDGYFLDDLLEEWGDALEDPKFRADLIRYLKIGRPEDRKALREIMHLRKLGHTWDEVDDLRDVSRGVSARFVRRWKKRHPGQNF